MARSRLVLQKKKEGQEDAAGQWDERLWLLDSMHLTWNHFIGEETGPEREGPAWGSR